MNKITKIEEIVGKTIYHIRLGRGDKTARIYKEDYEELMGLGVSELWCEGALNYVSCYCKGAPGNRIIIARALMDAGDKETVRYIDGDKTNLLKDNLVKMRDPKATRRARDFLKAKDAARSN